MNRWITAAACGAVAPFGTCQPNGGGGQIIQNNCRFRG